MSSTEESDDYDIGLLKGQPETPIPLNVSVWEWVVLGVIAFVSLVLFFVGLGILFGFGIVYSQENSYEKYYESYLNGTAPPFFMFDTAKQTVYTHFFFPCIFCILLGLPVVLRKWNTITVKGISFRDRPLNLFDDILTHLLLLAGLVGITWEVLWELYEVPMMQLITFFHPNEDLANRWVFACEDVVPDFVQGFNGGIYALIIIWQCTQLLKINLSPLIWDQRKLWNKIAYIVIVNLTVAVAPFEHFSNDYGGLKPFRLGALIWIPLCMFLFVCAIVLDLTVKIDHTIVKNYPTKKDIYKTYIVVISMWLFLHTVWYVSSIWDFNSYITTYTSATIFAIILMVIGLMKLGLTVLKTTGLSGVRVFGLVGLSKAVFSRLKKAGLLRLIKMIAHAIKLIFKRMWRDIVKLITPYRWFPVSFIVWNELILTYILNVILLICISLPVTLVMVLVDGDESVGWKGIYFNNIVLKHRFENDFVFMEYTSIIQWPYVHLWLPALLCYLFGGPLLIYYYYEKNKKVEVAPASNVWYTSIKKFSPPLSFVYLYLFVMGIGTEVGWEIIEWFGGEIIDVLNETAGDKIGDLVQAIVGCIFIAFVIWRNIWYIRRPSFLLWPFRSLFNKAMYLVLILFVGFSSFIGVFNKIFSSGVSVSIGALIWIWIQIAIMLWMRYLDMLVVIPTEIPEKDRNDYPNKRDINWTWIYLISSTLIMHFTFFFLSLGEHPMPSYISSYIGLLNILLFSVFMYVVRTVVKL